MQQDELTRLFSANMNLSQGNVQPMQPRMHQEQQMQQQEQEQEETIAPIYNGLGFAYFAQEQYDLAIRQYKEALKRDPKYITALNNLAHAYERKTLMTQALQTYDQVLELEPNNPNAKRRADKLRRTLVPSA